jgi:hypothetical protein
MKELLIKLGLITPPTIVAKSVESVLSAFTNTIADLKEVAENAKAEAKYNADYAVVVRQRADEQIKSLNDKSDAANAEAEKADVIAKRLEELLK